MFGSVNTAVGSTSPVAIFGSHLRFCSSVPLPRMSSAAISERVPSAADADIAARQLLGDDAHRFLAEPHAAVFLGDGQREHAEFGHLRDDFERDVLLRRCHCCACGATSVVGELAHFLADRLERFVEAAGADGRRRAACPISSTSRARRGAVLPNAIRFSTAGVSRAATAAGETEIGEAHELALAHRNAAEDLRQIFAGADAHQQFLDLAEPAARRQPIGIGRELADAPRHRSQAKRGRASPLLAVERRTGGRPCSLTRGAARRQWRPRVEASTAASAAWPERAIRFVGCRRAR